MPQTILFMRQSTSCNLQAIFAIEMKLVVMPQHQ